jgi:RNA polymerase sigma-70 factor (ECF subfamily)
MGGLFPAETQLRELMMASLAGDAAAYRDLLSELAARLRGYFRKRLAAAYAADAEDLVQETLLAVHGRRATYDPSRPFTAWVYAIAGYKLADYLRRRREQPTADLDEGESAAAEDLSEGALAQLDLHRLLEAIPAGPRTWIRSVRIEGRSIAEVAAHAGVSSAAVKVGIHRGLRALAGKVQGKP